MVPMEEQQNSSDVFLQSLQNNQYDSNNNNQFISSLIDADNQNMNKSQ